MQLQRSFKHLLLSRRLAENTLTLLLQYAGLTLSTYSPISFALGTACAFILLRGGWILPGVWLGSFLAYLTFSFPTAFWLATCYTLQTWLFRWFCYAFLQPMPLFKRNSDFFCYAAACLIQTALFTFLLHPSLNVASLYLWLAFSLSLILIPIALSTWDAYCMTILEWPIKQKALLIALLFFTIIGIINGNQVGEFMALVMLLCFFNQVGVIAGLFFAAFTLTTKVYINQETFFIAGTTLLGWQSILLAEALTLIPMSIALAQSVQLKPANRVTEQDD